MCQGQEEAATKVLKRARHEKPSQYKKKGNEEQASFNTCIDELLAEAQLDLPGPGSSAALEHAHKALERGRRLIAERQKLICVADCSELGWIVVSEYTVDELADDSEDEKRLEKAERLVEKKAAKHRKKCMEPPSIKQGARLVPATAAARAGPSGYQVPPLWPAGPSPQLFKAPGLCFACGEMGHIRLQCPKTD